MAFVNEGGQVTITCDKCGYQSQTSESNYNAVFYKQGRTLNTSGRKYKHKCYSCHTSKAKKAMLRFKEKFKHI